MLINFNQTKVQHFLAAISEYTGRGVSYLTVIMVVTMFVSTLLSNLFSINFIAVQESVTWLHATVFMLGAAYTLQKNEHVRVDVFYHKFSSKTQALINISGTLLFLWPVCFFIAFSSWRYIEISWRLGEASAEAGGLPALYLLKTLVIVMPVLLIIEGLNQLVINAQILRAQNKDQQGNNSGATL